jgi:hypothetical protein
MAEKYGLDLQNVARDFPLSRGVHIDPMTYPSTYPKDKWGYIPGPAVERLGKEATNTPLSSTEINTDWRSTCTSLHVFIVQCLV